MLPGVDPELVDALVAAGLGSPAAIVKAGREKLGLVATIGDRTDTIYLAAEKFTAAHRASIDTKAGDDVSQPETPTENPTRV